MEFDRSKHIAVDLETTGDEDEFGLQPWRVAQGRATIRAMSTAWWDENGRPQVKGVLDPTREQIRELLQFASQTNKMLVGWNTPFDASWMLAYGLEQEVMACRWLDAQLLWKHAEREPEYDVKGQKRKGWALEDAVREYMPRHVGFKQITNFHTTDPEELQRLLHRNKMDALCTLKLAEIFWNMLVPTQQRCATIEAAAISPIAGANLRGLDTNVAQCAYLDQKLGVVAHERLLELANHGATPEILASPQQLAGLLYDKWGLPVLKLTGSGQRSTDKESLYELAPSDKRAQLVKDYREANNNRTKFVANIAASAIYNGDGYTHPTIRMYGTYTGRVVYSSTQGSGVKEVQTGFAIAQMNRIKEFRETIKAPDGFKLVEFDAAGQEYRLMAELSGDPVMRGLCEPGEDAHSYMGAQIGRVDYKDLRRAAKDDDAHDHDEAVKLRYGGKFANLSFSYRVGSKKATTEARVKYGMDVDELFVSKIKRTYMNSYRKVEEYWNDSIRLARRQGYAESLGGRRVQLKGNWNGKLQWQLESTAINFRIQATGADQKFLAIAMIKPILLKYGGYFYFELHDGIYMILPDDKWQQAVAEIQVVLNSLPYQKAWGDTFSVPLPWDCKVGDSWGSLREYHAT
jgi:DNA polymerase I-like protein with 3'-5' exonuclease and polymerase domains